MSHEPVPLRYDDVIARIGQADFRRSRLLAAALVLVGIGAFGLLLATGHARQAWQSYLVNLVFFLGMAQAGVVWAAVARTTRGHRWASSLTRYGEALGAFLPIGFALTLVFLLAGGSQLYWWVEHPIAQKRAWLNWPFFVGRNVVLMGALVLFSRRLLGLSLRPDLGRARDRVQGKLKELYARRTVNWQGEAREDAAAQKSLLDLSPWLILLYCLTYTVWAFDVLMALDPHWISTLFGAFVFMSTLYTGLAALGLASIFTRKSFGFENWIGDEQFHTLGKLLFSFALFWVYSFWSQFLVIWYGNLSDETPYVFLRLLPQFRFWSWTVLILVFVIPFFGLMNWTTKRNPTLHAIFATIALAGVWLERNLLVLPSVNPTHFDFTLPQLGVMLGFLGAFVLAFLQFASRYPMISAIAVPDGAPEGYSGGH